MMIINTAIKKEVSLFDSYYRKIVKLPFIMKEQTHFSFQCLTEYSFHKNHFKLLKTMLMIKGNLEFIAITNLFGFKPHYFYTFWLQG